MHRIPLLLLALLVSTAAYCEDRLVVIPTRDGQTISYWWMPNDGATATVLLFSGGVGGIGYVDGKPTSANFLIRSRDYFRGEGVNVALVGNPSDKLRLDDAWRTSRNHLIDISNIIDDINQSASVPVWLVGTSRGTISAAAAGIALQQKISGVVLTASITSYQVQGAPAKQDLGDIKVPVLVYHHADDECVITVPRDTSWIMSGLRNAPIKRLMIVKGGENPAGNPCEALHWHGFIGMEARAVKDIVGPAKPVFSAIRLPSRQAALTAAG